MSLKLKDFDFELPNNLIAKYPTESRVECRLMRIQPKTKKINHFHFHELKKILKPNDLLILNDSFVIPARLKATKPTGGNVEIMLERPLNSNMALVQIKCKGNILGKKLIIENSYYHAKIIEKKDRFFTVEFNKSVNEIFERKGKIPIPPYMNRDSEEIDKHRYQTVYANHQHKGSVAAPTAGLHFDHDMLNNLKANGINITYICLNIGAGTFIPVSTENINEHQMHYEFFKIKQEVINKILKTKKNGGRIIAVGTTVVRCLETVFNSKKPKSGSYETNIFIYPSYQFKIIDGIITNFHTPKSSLLILVAAFINRELMFKAYQQAIEKNYKFYSYGDAMLILD